MKNTLEKIVTYLKEHRPVAICGGSILALVFVVCIIVAVISNSNKNSVVDAGIPSVNTESQNVAVNTSTTESEKDSVQTEMPETTATESQKPEPVTEGVSEIPATEENDSNNEEKNNASSSESNSAQKPSDSSSSNASSNVSNNEEKPSNSSSENAQKPSDSNTNIEDTSSENKEPEKESEKEPEKEPEKTLQEIVDEYKASCVEVEWEKFRFYKGKGPNGMIEDEMDDFEMIIAAREILNYDYADGQKVNDHEYKTISTRWIYNGAGEKALFTGYYAIAEADSIWPMKEYSLDLSENDFGSIIANCEYCSKTKNRIVFVTLTCDENYIW